MYEVLDVYQNYKVGEPENPIMTLEYKQGQGKLVKESLTKAIGSLKSC
jgi:hypothetical protein